MTPAEVRRMGRALRASEIAGRSTDPRFFHSLSVLPNPDPVLRQAGRDHEVFDAIQSDAHVMGELRAVRGGLLAFEHRVVVGDADAKGAAAAAELCERYLRDSRPAPGMTWPDVIWNMGLYVFRGQAFHEVVWGQDGAQLMPTALLDRPGRRFAYDPDNALRVLTRAQPVHGEDPGLYRILTTRHMHSADNPYGWAVFSSCFWPYTFKHAGFKWFVKYCERVGIPWAIGRYPSGTPEPDQDALEEGLQQLIEAAYAALPEGHSVELVEAKNGGGTRTPQQHLVHECNREMSKALTSQTLATEINETGARAASETHRDREQAGHACDREQIAYTFDELFRWITELNFGPDVPPPRFEFYEEQEARKERAEVFEIAARLSDNISEEAMLKELNIARAETDADRLQRRAAPPPLAPPAGTPPEFARGCPIHGAAHDHGAGNQPDAATARAAGDADTAIARDFLNPVAARLAEYEASGKTLQEFLADMPTLFADLDDAQLALLTRDAMLAAHLDGQAAVTTGDTS